jgi:parallel beta-helix repeat protein
MIHRLVPTSALLVAMLTAQSACAPRAYPPAAAPASDVVRVAPPTGERELDRASILAALERVRPGGTVQFAAGTYLMGGEIIRVSVPRVTLLGHPEGTTLRGCDPGEFPSEGRAEFGDQCNGLELAGGWETVRDLSVQIYGGTVHLLDNDISVPEPEKVQLVGFPLEGVHLARPFDLHESVEGERTCENNVIAANRIDGVTEGIMVTANEPGIICRNNVIRDNTIAVRRAHPPTMPGFIRVHDQTDSTLIGVPLALRGVAGESTLEDNLIEGNVIVGAEGLGIEIRNASRNKIVNNTVTRVVRREPFPGNSFVAMPLIGGNPEAWRGANGSGIWISPGSDGNEIVGNTFEDIAADAIVLEGDRNRVETRSASDAVRDVGAGNRGTRPYEPKFVGVRG